VARALASIPAGAFALTKQAFYTPILDRTRQLDDLNARLMDAVNRTGEVFLSHTRLAGRFTIRVALGHLRGEERHVARAWELLRREAAALG